jgi:hypothetical protein
VIVPRQPVLGESEQDLNRGGISSTTGGVEVTLLVDAQKNQLVWYRGIRPLNYPRTLFKWIFVQVRFERSRHGAAQNRADPASFRC